MTTKNKQKKTTPTPEQKVSSIDNVVIKIKEDINKEKNKNIFELLTKTNVTYLRWETSFFNIYYKNISIKVEEIQISDEVNTLIKEASQSYLESTISDINYNKKEHKINNIKHISKKINDTPYQQIYSFVLYKLLDEIITSKQKMEDSLEKEIKELKKTVYTLFIKNFINNEINKENKELFRDSTEFEEIRINKDTYFIPINENKNFHFLYSKDNINLIPRYLQIISEAFQTSSSIPFFRGQTYSFWKLDASIYRKEEFINNESKIFHDLIALKPDEFINAQNTYEKLITMQHFGLPTRLLDITKNPLIALFFACDDSLNDPEYDDGKVLLFDIKTTEKDKQLEEYYYYSKEIEQLDNLFLKKNDNDNNEKPILDKLFYLHGYANNPRITNQCGSFIYVGKDSYKNELNELPIHEIIIPKSCKNDILKELEMLNIHAGTIYPDLSNMSKYLKYKYTTKNN